MKGSPMQSKSTGANDVEAYLAALPDETRAILRTLRAAIRVAAPDATEKIAYQMPTFAQEGNLVHFAAQRNHIGFYPTPSGVEAFKEETSAYVSTKGSLHFPFDQPLPLDLISRIVRFRVQENLARAAAKARKRAT